MENVSLKPKWIISKKDDLVWLIYPALISFLIIGLYFLMTRLIGISENITILSIYISWALLFDGTHAFATYTRTYFDKEFFSQNKKFLLKSLLVFTIGPIFIFSSYLVNQDINQTTIAFIIFNRIGICYAYYHLIKQHWGFMVLYRKKNNEQNSTTRKLDGLLLAFGTIFPFVHGQINKIQLLHLSETFPISLGQWKQFSFYLLILGLFFLILSNLKRLRLKAIGFHIISWIIIIASLLVQVIIFLSLSRFLLLLSILSISGFIATVIYYVYFVISEKILLYNKPKWLLLFTVLLCYNIAFHLNLPIFILIAAITVFHNIQYHRIINFHNVNKYKNGKKEIYGYAVILAQKISVFIVAAFLFGLVVYLPRFASYKLDDLLLNYLLSAFFWGLAFHHYYIDSVIWRIKGTNNNLNKDLKLN